MEIGVRAPNPFTARRYVEEAGLSLDGPLREMTVDHYDQVFTDGDQLSYWVTARYS